MVSTPVGWGSHSRTMAEARREASLARSRALLSVSRGEATLQETIQRAARPGEGALLRIRLAQLLMSLPDMGRRRSHQLLHRMLHVLEDDPGQQVASLTISWLLNPHSGGRRWEAWVDVVMSETDKPVWAGFPWSPSPYLGRGR